MPDELDTTEIAIQIAELKFMHGHLTSRARICYLMIGASVTCLVAGVVMLIIGITGNQSIWLESSSLKVTAGGFGAVTLLASVAWGFIAFLSRPEIRYASPYRDVSLFDREETATRRFIKNSTRPR